MFAFPCGSTFVYLCWCQKYRKPFLVTLVWFIEYFLLVSFWVSLKGDCFWLRLQILVLCALFWTDNSISKNKQQMSKGPGKLLKKLLKIYLNLQRSSPLAPVCFCFFQVWLSFFLLSNYRGPDHHKCLMGGGSVRKVAKSNTSLGFTFWGHFLIGLPRIQSSLPSLWLSTPAERTERWEGGVLGGEAWKKRWETARASDRLRERELQRAAAISAEIFMLVPAAFPFPTQQGAAVWYIHRSASLFAHTPPLPPHRPLPPWLCLS